MTINWFTVIAQIINFLILVWLLKRFLYKPILKAIDEREKNIAAQLQDAGDKKAAAIKEQDDFKKRNDDFDGQKKALMDKAVADTNTQRNKWFEEAKNEANTLRSNMEKATKEKQDNDQLAREDKTQKQVFTITKKALADMASLNLEEQLVNTFIKRLNELKEEEKKQFIEAFQSAANAVLVRSAFDLSVAQQAEINIAVNQQLETKTVLQFTTSPQLISGIELATNGYKLAWSFSEYLNSFQKNIAVTTKDKPKPQMNAEPVNI